MTAIHEFKCDGCRKKIKAYYNGEHWLPPTGWVEIMDSDRAELTGDHLCEKCRPKVKKSREVEE